MSISGGSYIPKDPGWLQCYAIAIRCESERLLPALVVSAAGGSRFVARCRILPDRSLASVLVKARPAHKLTVGPGTTEDELAAALLADLERRYAMDREAECPGGLFADALAAEDEASVAAERERVRARRTKVEKDQAAERDAKVLGAPGRVGSWFRGRYVRKAGRR